MSDNYNFLLGSVGRRATLLQYIKKEWEDFGLIGGIDIYNDAPGLQFVDMARIVPPVKDVSYTECVLSLCKEWNIKCITSLLDVETVAMSSFYDKLYDNGILPLLPDHESACICFDKLKFYNYLKTNDIPTIPTYTVNRALSMIENKELSFPVFIKPRTGAGSVEARKVTDMEGLIYFAGHTDSELIVQPYIEGDNCNANIYVDSYSDKIVSVFMKKIKEMRIGGPSKTISFFSPSLLPLFDRLNDIFSFHGTIDVDFFIMKDGSYLITEINPRFGGSYLHAHESGINFPRLIKNNLLGKINERRIGDYPVDTVMSMYDSVTVNPLSQLPRKGV